MKPSDVVTGLLQFNLQRESCSYFWIYSEETSDVCRCSHLQLLIPSES